VRIREAAARIMRCLAEFDPDAVDCLDSDRAVFQALFDPATFARFERHVGAYAFAEAQALLDEVLLARSHSLDETPVP
jgi:hypothetical protein